MQCAVHDRSASIFLFPRFSASNEPRGWGVRAGLGWGEGYNNDESILISDFQMSVGVLFYWDLSSATKDRRKITWFSRKLSTRNLSPYYIVLKST